MVRSRRVHLDAGYPPPARGHHIANILQGVARVQAQFARATGALQRTYLRAHTLAGILAYAEKLADPFRPETLGAFRDAVQVLFATVMMDRRSTSTAIQERDLELSSAGLNFIERIAKGRDAVIERRVLPAPASAFPRVQRLLRQFRAARGPLPPDAPFFALSARDARPSLDDALTRTLRRTGLAAPSGCFFSSHSCRKCATLAHAAGVDKIDICYWGGWASTGDAVDSYIDSACRLDGVDLSLAREFFGWLRRPV